MNKQFPHVWMFFKASLTLIQLILLHVKCLRKKYCGDSPFCSICGQCMQCSFLFSSCNDVGMGFTMLGCKILFPKKCSRSPSPFWIASNTQVAGESLELNPSHEGTLDVISAENRGWAGPKTWDCC